MQLRERHADRGYVEAEDAENGADVVSLEEDMALRWGEGPGGGRGAHGVGGRGGEHG